MVRCELCEVVFRVATVSRENGRSESARGLYKRQIIGEPYVKAERKFDC